MQHGLTCYTYNTSIWSDTSNFNIIWIVLNHHSGLNFDVTTFHTRNHTFYITSYFLDFTFKQTGLYTCNCMSKFAKGTAYVIKIYKYLESLKTTKDMVGASITSRLHCLHMVAASPQLYLFTLPINTTPVSKIHKNIWYRFSPKDTA